MVVSRRDVRRRAEHDPIEGRGGNVNLYLTDNRGGGDLPEGAAWNVESLCDTPRDFRIIAVDAITGEIKGAIRCDAPCNR